jgi:hypothetical protein
MMINWRTALPQTDIFERSTLQNVPAVLASYKLRYIVIHQTMLNGEELQQMRLRVQETFGDIKPVYQDAEITVYRTPEALGQPPAEAYKTIYQELGDGWGARDFGGGSVRRAINPKATLTLTNPYQSAVEIELELQAQAQTRNLQINLNDVLLATPKIEPNGSTVKLRLKLNPGVNRLTFTPENGNTPVWVNSVKVRQAGE